VAQPVLGEAHVRISPDVSRFAADLQRSLAPQLAQVERSIQRTFGTAGFAQAGQQAASGFTSSFDKGFKQQASGLFVPFSAGLEKAGDEGAKKAINRIGNNRKGFAAEGEKSGRTFGGGFGEGFAALAAFAIASRIRRFFTEITQSAIDFESAFTGVQKTVQGTPEQFERLEKSIINLGTRSRDALPFATTEIARIAQIAGQLGVPIESVTKFTETILKFSTTAQDLSAEEAATAFARFARVTQEPLVNIERLASVVTELGNTFAANEGEILRFSQNIAGLAQRFDIPASDIIAFGAASREAGVNIEAGGTAIQRVLAQLVAAASGGGAELTSFLAITKLTREEFQRLAQTDLGTLFVRFVEGLQGSGTELSQVLDDVGLGTERIEREISKISGAADSFTRAFASAREEVVRNEALQREFALRLETTASKLTILQNRIGETRRQIGEKLAPALLFATGAMASLGAASTGLTAAFAGLVAGAFAFNRLRHIFGELATNIGGARLTVGQFSAALGFSQATGESLRTTLRGLKNGTLEFKVATDGTTVTVQRLASTEAAANAQRLSSISAFRVARVATADLSAHQAALNLQYTIAHPIIGRATVAMQGFTQTLRAQASAAAAAAAGIGPMRLLLGGLVVAASVAIGVDLLNRALEALQEKLDKFRGRPGIAEVDDAFADLAENGSANIDVLIDRIGAFGSSSAKAAIDAGNLGDAIDNALTSPVRFLGSVIPGANVAIEQLRKEFQFLDERLKSLVEGGSVETVRKDIENLASALNITPEQLLAVLDETKVALDQVGAAARIAGIEAKLSGDGAAEGAEGFGEFGDAAKAAAGALNAIKAAQAEYQQRVDSFIPTFGELVVEQRKSGAAADKAAKDTRTSARQIAEAQRALARAREDGNRRIAEAERRLAEAEEDAAERIFNARIRLQDTRISQTRRVRDAQQALQDFQAALARVGGAQTPEDLLRLRDLEQAAADVREDAKRADDDAVRDVRQAQEDGAEAVEEAQRRIVEAQREAAERVADAQRRLAEAMEKSAERGAAAAQSVADTIVRTTSSLVESFRTNTRLLNTFAANLESLAPRVFDIFGDRDVGEAFLARLAELGPDAIPLLRKLNKTTDKELEGIIKAFDSNIKAAKRVADQNFTRFPPNFEKALAPAVKSIEDKMAEAIGAFDALGDAGADTADATAAELTELGLNLERFAREGALNLSTVEKGLLLTGTSAADSGVKIEAMRELLESLRSRNVTLNFDAKTDKAKRKFELFIKDILDTDLGGGVTLGEFPGVFQHGGPIQAGQAGLVGEAGRELFVPSTDGTIISHRETERILRALSGLAPTGGGFVQHVTVNEVAQDPIATARAVSWAVARGAVR